MRLLRQSIWWIWLLAVLWPPAAGAQEYSWLAYGDFRGQFEPCGCDPRTDLGGVQRLAGFALRERALNPEVLFFDLGNNIAPPKANSNADAATQGIKDRFLLEALIRINPAVVLPGRYELLRSRWMGDAWTRLKAAANAGGPLPYVLSNLKEGLGPQWLKESAKPFIKIKGVAVFGFTWDPALASFLLPATSPAGIRRLKILGGNPELAGLYKILLFNGPDPQLKALIKLSLFDEVISSNRASDTAKPDQPDRANEGRSIVRLTIPRGAMVLQSQLGGQGVLRGGAARRSEAKSLEAIFSKGSSQTSPLPSFPPPALALAPLKNVSWLERDSLNPEVWSAFFFAYESALKDSFDVRAKIRLADLVNTPFAGSQACKGCHAKAYDVWAASKHSNAFKDLIDKGKQHDAECVGCHVLGGSEKGGFVSQEASPQFMNVQCENCHGPRKEHATNPTAKPRWKPAGNDFAKICTGCHHPPHSPEFDFKAYWGKIIHGHMKD